MDSGSSCGPRDNIILVCGTIQYSIELEYGSVRYGYRSSSIMVRHKCFCIESCFAFLAACCSVSHVFAVCHKIWLYRRDALAAILPKQFKFKKQTSRTIFRG